jgi:hypothetical protein
MEVEYESAPLTHQPVAGPSYSDEDEDDDEREGTDGEDEDEGEDPALGEVDADDNDEDEQEQDDVPEGQEEDQREPIVSLSRRTKGDRVDMASRA